MYIYMEASDPVKPGDTVQLKSSVMVGAKCFSFSYHMSGQYMGGLIIYARCTSGSGDLRPLWVKSGNQVNKWIDANINVNVSCQYQVRNSPRTDIAPTLISRS